MAKSRRAQVMMEPSEYRVLERLARRNRTTVSDLIRSAVEEKFFSREEQRVAAAEAIGALSLDVGEWDELRAELEETRSAGVY
jgi:predicted transcriptional regulator